MACRVLGAAAGVLAAGCSFHPNPSAGDAQGGKDDAPIDMAIAKDGSADGGGSDAGCGDDSVFFDPCALPDPGGDLVLTGAWTFDTDEGILRGPNNTTITPASTVLTTITPAARAISAASFALDASSTLRVTGSLPLIIATPGLIELRSSSIVFANSEQGGSIGPGAGTGTCDAGAGHDEADTGGGSGGGGGGGFGGKGGIGGPGDTGKQNAGGTAGSKLAALPHVIEGGCAGAASGKAGPDPAVTTPSDANTTAAGGAGGGGILLWSKTEIHIQASAKMTAGGAGGQGAELHSAVGGGGGGAGGMLAFEAPVFTTEASVILAANGGGGGSSGPFASTGVQGVDGGIGATPAGGGGPNGACAHAGGTGAAGSQKDGQNVPQDDVSCGGGGGGGGSGLIVVQATTNTIGASNTLSPAPHTNEL